MQLYNAVAMIYSRALDWLGRGLLDDRYNGVYSGISMKVKALKPYEEERELDRPKDVVASLSVGTDKFSLVPLSAST